MEIEISIYRPDTVSIEEIILIVNYLLHNEELLIEN